MRLLEILGLDPLQRRWDAWRRRPLGGELDREILSVAVLIDDTAAFEAEAARAASRLGRDSMRGLARRLHRRVDPPPGFGYPERDFGAWIRSWTFAIFEIAYHFRESALPMLRREAFGAYDWSQANAIEILCRLAAEGVDRVRTIADLKRKLPTMRPEALEYAVGPLLPRLPTDPRLASVVAELRQVEAFEEAVRSRQLVFDDEARSRLDSPEEGPTDAGPGL